MKTIGRGGMKVVELEIDCNDDAWQQNAEGKNEHAFVVHADDLEIDRIVHVFGLPSMCTAVIPAVQDGWAELRYVHLPRRGTFRCSVVGY